jgi:hypothetical protein
MSSWLANLTGVHISPKKAYVDKQQLKRAALTAGGIALGGVGGAVLSKVAPKIGGIFKGGAGDMAGDAIDGLSGGDIAGSRGGGFNLDNLLKYGQAAGDAYGAYTGAKDQDRYRRIAEQEYAKRAPMRDASQRLLMDESRPDLSSVFTEQPGRYRRVNVGSRG